MYMLAIQIEGFEIYFTWLHVFFVSLALTISNFSQWEMYYTSDYTSLLNRDREILNTDATKTLVY